MSFNKVFLMGEIKKITPLESKGVPVIKFILKVWEKERKEFDYKQYTADQLAARKAERKAAKEAKRQEKQEKQEQAKSAVELAIQQEQAIKAVQPTQAPNYISEDIRKKAEEDEMKRRDKEAKENEENRQLELNRKKRIDDEKLAEQEENERQQRLELIAQNKRNEHLAAEKALKEENKRQAEIEKKAAELKKKLEDEKALEEALKEKAKQNKESEKPSTSRLDKPRRSIKEIQFKNKVKDFLEEIKEKQEDIDMENELEKEEEKDPMSDESFILRSKLYERYKLLLENIKDTMNDLKNKINKYLTDDDKMAFLQNIRDRKKNLKTLLAVIFKKDTFYTINEWENYYIQNILPLEEELAIFKESDSDDASEIRRSLIRYYRDEYKVKSLKWDRLELEILSEEDANIIRDKIRDLNAKVDAETRSKILSEVEAEYLNLVYKDQDDTFDEPDEQIIEHLRILNPKFSDINLAKLSVEKAKQKRVDEGKKFFSTTTLLLMYPRLYDPTLFATK